MHVAHVVPSLEDRYGGPSRSVRAVANALTRDRVATTVLATRTATSAPMLPGTDAARFEFFAREFPRWLCRSSGLHRHLEQRHYDCLHHHSIWLLTLRYAAGAARQHGIPLVISPRGMFSPWAYQHHRWRKRLAAALVHPGAFATAAGWHATSDEEMQDIRRLGFEQPVCVAPNGVDLPPASELAAARAHWQTTEPLAARHPVALFYSRLHRKKRVLELIDLWLGQPRGDWRLLLVGVPEEYSVDQLRQIVARAGGAGQISVHDGRSQPPPYAAASLFVLPSHSENFGLVVAEALAAGVPVLVTDSTPWSQLESKAAGRCLPWQDFSAGLADLLLLPPEELAAMGARGRRWMLEDYSWSRAAQRLAAFYRTLIDAPN